MDFFGYALTAKDLVEAGKTAAPVGIALVATYGFGKKMLDRYFNREFDTWIVSVTSATAVDKRGRRRLELDNLGSPERFNDAVRGTKVREWMDAAAKQCSWQVPQRRFVLLPKDRQAAMLHAARNAITKYWQDGLRAKMAGLPVTKRDYYFAVTGSDAAANTKQLYRIPVFTKEDAIIFLDHPEDMWDFDEPTHRVRLVTCRIMAAALINGENSIVVEGVTYQIVQWLRAYERV